MIEFSTVLIYVEKSTTNKVTKIYNALILTYMSKRYIVNNKSNSYTNVCYWVLHISYARATTREKRPHKDMKAALLQIYTMTIRALLPRKCLKHLKCFWKEPFKKKSLPSLSLFDLSLLYNLYHVKESERNGLYPSS